MRSGTKIRTRKRRGVGGESRGGKEGSGFAIEIKGDAGMSAENARGDLRIDRSLESGLDGLGFAGFRNGGNDLGGLENLANGHGDGAGGDVRERFEPAFADLLTAAGFIEIDEEVGIFGIEIGGRIVEGEVSVLADADESEINGGSEQVVGGGAEKRGGIGVAVECVVTNDGGLIDEATLKIVGEAGWVSDGQAEVLIELKEFDGLPWDRGRGDEGLEKFELRGASCGDEAGDAGAGDGLAKERSGVRRGGQGKRISGLTNTEDHEEYSLNRGSATDDAL